jgi:hypothetical protein
LFEYESQNPENVAGIVETKTFRYTDAATKYIGKSTIPKVRGAFTLSTKYKAFSLSTQFLYSLGGYYDGAYAQLMHSGLIGSNNWSTFITDEMAETSLTYLVYQIEDLSSNGVSSRFITKTDYLSLNNVRLGFLCHRMF